MSAQKAAEHGSLEKLSNPGQVLFEVIACVEQVRDSGLLNDIVLIGESIGAIPKRLFHFVAHRARIGEGVSSDVYNALVELREKRVVFDTGPEHTIVPNPRLVDRKPKRVDPAALKAVASIPTSNDVATLAKLVQASRELKINLAKRQLTSRDYRSLFGAMLFPKPVVDTYHSMFRRLTESQRPVHQHA